MTIRNVQSTTASAAGATNTKSMISAESPKLSDILGSDLDKLSPTIPSEALDLGRKHLAAVGPCGGFNPGSDFECVQGRNHQGRSGSFWRLKS
ncbi:MAG: hypothetical protein HY791_03150 [Deltaproteobacteria bacterium]|nr:hypothetical protein [Deltaproteobacteria bacterium]